MILVGVVVGFRYGNMERYHTAYDPETGTIDSNHPFATLSETVSRSGGDSMDDPPAKFVLSRRAVAAVCFSPLLLVGWVVLTNELLAVTASVLILGITLVACTAVFVVSDRVVARMEPDHYP